MLTRAKINWFRSLKEISLDLSPFTVLVGPNASGKSSILQALNPSYVPLHRDLWMHQRRNFMFRFEYDDGQQFQREIAPDSHSIREVARYEYQLLRLDLNRLRGPNAPSQQLRIASDGENLTNVFLSLGRTLQIQIAQELSELVRTVSDVDVRPDAQHAGLMRLVFQDRWKTDVLYYPNEVSDGTMLLLAFLVCRHQSPAPSLLAIEEPERGLHPYLLGELVGIFRKLSAPDPRESSGSAPIQVVVATHSAELLNHLRPEEVRFLSRNEKDGSVAIEKAPIDTPEWERAVEEYRHSMRSLWLSGGLGGVPGS